MAVNMKRCEKCGSFYNAAQMESCPYCSDNGADVGNTTPIMSGAQDIGATAPVDYERTVAASMMMDASDDGRTVPVMRKMMGIDPVVGWLVAVNGPEKGRDYKIHSDNNYIGRSENMDICIHGDDTISRENHAFITFDCRDRVFYITPGEGRSLVRVNGKALLTPSQLGAYDNIEIGTTVLVFVPLCGQQFDWTMTE